MRGADSQSVRRYVLMSPSLSTCDTFVRKNWYFPVVTAGVLHALDRVLPQVLAPMVIRVLEGWHCTALALCHDGDAKVFVADKDHRLAYHCLSVLQGYQRELVTILHTFLCLCHTTLPDFPQSCSHLHLHQREGTLPSRVRLDHLLFLRTLQSASQYWTIMQICQTPRIIACGCLHSGLWTRGARTEDRKQADLLQATWCYEGPTQSRVES